MTGAPILLPCPFCGSAARLVEGHLDHWQARCSGCGANTSRWFPYEGAKEGAAEAWNARNETSNEVVEALRLAIELFETDNIELWRTVPDKARAALSKVAQA